MTISLVTTVGATTANSYVSLADANTYLDTHLDSALWTALTDDEKKKFLLNACRQIDCCPCIGQKVTYTQALQFPRYGQENVGDFADVSLIPSGIKNAQCEQAVYLIKHGMSRRDDLRAAGVVSVSIAKVTETLQNSFYGPIEIAPMALGMMQPYLRRYGVVE